MSFDNKYYPNRKDWRKPYYGRGAACRGDRPNRGCSYCYSNRFHSTHKRELSANDKLNDISDALHKITDEELLFYMITEPDIDWEYLDSFTLEEWEEIERYITNAS